MAKFAIVTSILAVLACSVRTEFFPNIASGELSPSTSGASEATKLQETIRIDLTKTKSVTNGLTKLVNGTVENTPNQKSDGLLLPAITKSLENTLALQVKDVQNLQEKIAEEVKEAENITETFTAELTSSVGTAIDEHTATIGNIVKKTTGGVSSCLSFSINFQKIANELASGTVACAENSLVKLLTETTKVVDELRDAVIALNDIALKTAWCIAEKKSTVFCITSAWMLLAKHSASFWTRLLAEAAALNIAFLTFKASLAVCRFTSAIASLADSAQKSAAKTAKCVSNLS